MQGKSLPIKAALEGETYESDCMDEYCNVIIITGTEAYKEIIQSFYQSRCLIRILIQIIYHIVPIALKKGRLKRLTRKEIPV